MKGFLYGQTEYNILENACHLQEYVAFAKQKECDFLTITDGNLAGHLKFYKECKSKGIKPIIGLEVKIKREIAEDRFLLYAFNQVGYKNLLHLASIKALKEINLTDLTKYQEGIFFIIVANDSILISSLSANCPQEAKVAIEQYRQQLKAFYVGISFQNAKWRDYNLSLATLAAECGIKSVYIHKMLYLTEEDRKVYQVLKRIQGYQGDFEAGDYSFYEETEEIRSLASDYLENTKELVNQVNLTLLEKKVRMPKFPLKNGIDSNVYLRDLAKKGLDRRLSQKKNFAYNLYLSRLNKELEIIQKMNFSDYFLIVWDFIRYAKKNNILVGPGRGSAAGSLVAYSLGITDVDPLEYGLLFERFLNPERISMPDIDTDFPDDKRDQVINYVKNFYGKTHVASITTFGTFSIKSSLRDLGRVLKIEGKRLEEITKLINSTTDYDTLLASFKYRPDLYDFIYIMKRLDGLPRNTSTHAAGIIISDIDLLNVIPFQHGPNEVFQSQLDADDLNAIGLLKMDFLGIRNLTIIDNVLKEINRDASWLRKINLNDNRTLELLRKADTLGVFQLESEGIRKVLMKLAPTNFNDLVAVLALYRPGPMEIIDEFIARKQGKKFSYLHNDLIPILKDTYGFIVYQEQIMEIARKFASYSLGEADLLRRAVSKKSLETLENERAKFVLAATKNGYKLEIAQQIYDYIVKFANYGFNKSHSVAYALVSYQMAYLKTYYLGNFMANILNNVIGSATMLEEYLLYARNHGLKVLNPEINISCEKFVVIEDKLYLPLTSISGIGTQLSQQIILERSKGKFMNFNDFKTRCPFINTKIMEALIFTSALDEFKKSKKALMENKSLTTSLIDKYLKGVIENNTEYDEEFLASQELKYLGFYLKYDPTKKLALMRNKKNTMAIGHISKFGTYSAVVRLKSLKVIKTKTGKVILRGTMYDDTGSLGFVMFQNLYEEVSGILNENTAYLVGFTTKKEEGYELEGIVNFVTNI